MVGYPDTWSYRHVPCLTPSHSWSSEIIWELFLLFRSDLCLHCWSLPFMKTSKIKLACFYFPRSSSHIKILITATIHPCRCAKCYNSGNCNINIFGGHFFKKYYVFIFFFFWSCRHGSGFFKPWELLTLLPRYKRYKTQPHWGGYSAHHKAQAGIMKDKFRGESSSMAPRLSLIWNPDLQRMVLIRSCQQWDLSCTGSPHFWVIWAIMQNFPEALEGHRKTCKKFLWQKQPHVP